MDQSPDDLSDELRKESAKRGRTHSGDRLVGRGLSPTVRASFELLGLEPGTASAGASSGADGTELKKAYRKLALLYHPDRNSSPTAAADFLRVTEAYELLLDGPRVAELNRRHRRERLGRKVIDGFELTFGSFFGYRTFDHGRPIEENNSVLDNAAYDAIEVVYAGKFSVADEERLQNGESRRAGRLPWVVLNNQGILRFLDGDLRGAKKCYEELNERIPNNILFMYRLAVCLLLDAFRSPRRALFGGLLGAAGPDKHKIEKAVLLLRHCIKLGDERPIGRQRCLVIRKTLADVLERTGKRFRARALWRAIRTEDPGCVEAAFKVAGPEAARALLRKKGISVEEPSAPLRLRGRS